MKINKNWINYIKSIKLSRLEVMEGTEYEGSQKQNIVLSKLALFIILISSLHLLDDSLRGSELGDDGFWLRTVEALMVLVALVTYILNEKGKHEAAKHMLLLSFNILLFALNAVAPRESGSYFFFFPLMVATFVFFGYKHQIMRYFYLGLTISLFILLTIFDFDMFGIMVEMDTEYDFLTNLISSLILTVMTVSFLININTRTELYLRNSQLAMKDLMDDLNEKNVNLGKVNAELDRFVYSVSHDLRAPLMSILGLINLSSMEDSAEKHKTYLIMMEDMVNKLDNFIHEVIDYTRNIKADVVNVPMDIEELIREVLEDLKFMEGFAQITFKVDTDLDGPFIADKARLSTALKNLVTNSIKYQDKNKANSFIHIYAAHSGDKRLLSVEDNGQGIDDIYQPQVFDMFFRGTESSEGSGLGLYIVMEIVHKLGGEVSLESELDRGTKITITF